MYVDLVGLTFFLSFSLFVMQNYILFSCLNIFILNINSIHFNGIYIHNLYTNIFIKN